MHPVAAAGVADLCDTAWSKTRLHCTCRYIWHSVEDLGHTTQSETGTSGMVCTVAPP